MEVASSVSIRFYPGLISQKLNIQMQAAQLVEGNQILFEVHACNSLFQTANKEFPVYALFSAKYTLISLPSTFQKTRYCSSASRHSRF
jgi:hypothetical protein